MEQWKKIAIVCVIGIVLKITLNLLVKKPKTTLNERIRILIRQTARWAVAAQQDKSPIIALLHANYGAGYMWALLDIATEDEIIESSGLNIIDFKKKILEIQDNATRKVSKNCPQFTEDIDKGLARLGGDI